MKFDFLNKLNVKVVAVSAIAAVLVVGSGTVLAISASSSGSKEISEQEAKAAAFAHAGISEDDVLSLHVSKSTEDGSPVYEIDFKTADKSYDYDIARDSGEVLQSSYDAILQESAGSTSQENSSAGSAPDDAQSSSQNTSSQMEQSNSATISITQDQAKSIALQDAGVAESDTQFLWVKEDYDDGRAIYEVEFYANGTEYDYDIEKSTGRILSSDYDIENYSPNTEQSNSANNENEAIISLDEARNLVLAKVSGATVNDVRIHLDRDDGRQIYEGEINYNQMEYEFEIDASTGNIIEWSAERWD